MDGSSVKFGGKGDVGLGGPAALGSAVSPEEMELIVVEAIADDFFDGSEGEVAESLEDGF